jgi:hypothetical protein
VVVDLTRLVPGAIVRLPGSNETVRLITVEPGAFWSFVYEHPGGLERITLSEEELGGVAFLDLPDAPAFDGDPERFRLGLEARRIKTIFTSDPFPEPSGPVAPTWTTAARTASTRSGSASS